MKPGGRQAKEKEMKTIDLKDLIKLYGRYNLLAGQARKAELWSELMAKAAKLQAAIDEAQRGCSVRLLTVRALLENLSWIEEKYDLTKKAWDGVAIMGVDVHAHTFPSAYHGIPMSTQFDVIHRRGSWRVTGIYRDVCNGDVGHVLLTEAAKAAILDKAEWI